MPAARASRTVPVLPGLPPRMNAAHPSAPRAIGRDPGRRLLPRRRPGQYVLMVVVSVLAVVPGDSP